MDTSGLSSFDWVEYIQRESLIRYVGTNTQFPLADTDSIIMYIFALDSAFAQFYHHPPRMTLSEMSVGLATPDACFQATSAEECFVELKTWRCSFQSPAETLTIASAVEALCDSQTSSIREYQCAFAQLSVLNMFTIISALYAETHRLATSVIRPFDTSQRSALSTALRQWRGFWPSPVRDTELAGIDEAQSESQSPKAVGFIRHAPEYWLLTHLILEHGIKQEGRNGVFAHANCEEADEMTQTRALITNFQNMDPSELG